MEDGVVEELEVARLVVRRRQHGSSDVPSVCSSRGIDIVAKEQVAEHVLRRERRQVLGLRKVERDERLERRTIEERAEGASRWIHQLRVEVTVLHERVESAPIVPRVRARERLEKPVRLLASNDAQSDDQAQEELELLGEEAGLGPALGALNERG